MCWERAARQQSRRRQSLLFGRGRAAAARRRKTPLSSLPHARCGAWLTLLSAPPPPRLVLPLQVKTPGGSLVLHYMGKKGSTPKCGDCKGKLSGVRQPTHTLFTAAQHKKLKAQSLAQKPSACVSPESQCSDALGRHPRPVCVASRSLRCARASTSASASARRTCRAPTAARAARRACASALCVRS